MSPPAWGGGKSGGGLLPDLRHLVRFQFAHAPQPLLQRFAHHQLHHEVRQLGHRVFIDLVDGDEVVVGDGGSGTRFAAEPLAGHLIISQ